MTGKPVKKHRMSIRYENGDENGLISKLNARFCPHFPAVLNCYPFILDPFKMPAGFPDPIPVNIVRNIVSHCLQLIH